MWYKCQTDLSILKLSSDILPIKRILINWIIHQDRQNKNKIIRLINKIQCGCTCRNVKEWHRCAYGHQRSWWQSWLQQGSGCKCDEAQQRNARRTNQGHKEPAPWNELSSPGPYVQGPWPCPSWNKHQVVRLQDPIQEIKWTQNTAIIKGIVISIDTNKI